MTVARVGKTRRAGGSESSSSQTGRKERKRQREGKFGGIQSEQGGSRRDTSPDRLAPKWGIRQKEKGRTIDQQGSHDHRVEGMVENVR